jgi:Uma2 family endonuclease
MTMALPAVYLDKETLTYDDYMSEGEINLRYDIIDGERLYMTSPTDWHQDILGNIYEMLRAYQRQHHTGRATQAPRDILIARDPLRTRQPDVLFISRQRYGDRKLSDPSPLSPAPELVVEILSPSESRNARAAKIADYCKVDVRECWMISPKAQTVEVLRLSPTGSETVDIYGRNKTVTSITFPDLSIAVADVFYIEE